MLAQRKIERFDEVDKEMEISKVFWRKVYNSLSIMLLILDDRGEAIDCNNALRKYIKKPKNEIVGKLLLEIVSQVGIFSDENLFNALELTHRRQSVELKAGNKYLKITADPVVDEKKKIKNIIVIINDITERKNNLLEIEKREKKYKDLVELSNIAIVTDDEKGRIKYFNKHFANLLGYKKEEIINIPRKKFIHPNDLNKIIRIHRNRIAGKKQPPQYDFRGIKKDGSTIYINVSVTNILDDNGKIIGTRSYLKDITERKRFISELENALKKAQESDRLKSAFLANLSHEIRTPLNGIMGFSKLLGHDSTTKEERKNYIKVIDDCSNQLLTIVSDILDISMIETGQVDINKEEVKIIPFLELIYQRFKIKFDEKNIAFDYKVLNPGNLTTIITDKSKLGQILSNLINNALKFTNKGKVELYCDIKEDQLIFNIKDTGIGIDKSMQNKIFERFRQIKTDFLNYNQGNGLGLSISKGFVEALGGRIWVQSSKGKGSVFSFTIPSK